MNNLLSSQQLSYPESQIYEYVSSQSEDVRESREINGNNFSKRRKNKTQYPSPLWFRDTTKRLQRKPIHKSTSFGSAINEIGSADSFIIDDEYNRLRDNAELLQFTPIRRSTSLGSSLNVVNGMDLTLIPDEDIVFRSSRFNSNSTKHLRRKVPVQNENIFNSTMMNSNSRKVQSEIDTFSEAIFETVETPSPLSSRRNHTGQFKISNSWIDWTPFWSRDDESKRLDRRHYISDFLEI